MTSCKDAINELKQAMREQEKRFGALQDELVSMRTKYNYLKDLLFCNMSTVEAVDEYLFTAVSILL